MGVHHIGQKQGRADILEDYHLRIGDVTVDTDAPDNAPVHEQRFDETEIGAKFATVTELTPEREACNLTAALGLDTSRQGLARISTARGSTNNGTIQVILTTQENRQFDSPNWCADRRRAQSHFGF